MTAALASTRASSPRLRVHALGSQLAGPFNLHVDAGECVVLMGRSGSGKTVLLRLIADLDRSNAGAVELDGVRREHWSGPQWRRKVIYQPAEPAWWSPVVRDHFEAAAFARTEAAAVALGLAPSILDADVAQLSTGERQRLALLRSLSRDPTMLLLDEPTAALDLDSTHAYEDLLREELARGMALLWVTHSVEQARRVGHRCLALTNRSLQDA